MLRLKITLSRLEQNFLINTLWACTYGIKSCKKVEMYAKGMSFTGFICKTQVNLIIKVYFILKANTFVFDRNKASRRTLHNSMTYNRGHITPPMISKWKGETSMCRISHIFHILWRHIVWITLQRQIKYLKFYSCAICLPWKQMVTIRNQVWVCLKSYSCD